MASSKFTVSIMAIVAMVLVFQMSSATNVSAPIVNGTSNGTLVNKPVGPVVVPPVASNNASAAHLRVRRKGLGGVGGAVAGGVASGAALSLIPGIIG